MMAINYNDIASSFKYIVRKINSKKILAKRNYFKKKNYEKYFENYF